MVGRMSRAWLFAGLRPRNWVCVYQKEDPVGDPVFHFHMTQFNVQASHFNTANTTILIQDSADGVSWTTRLTSAALVPGGMLNLSTAHVDRWVRVIAYSTGTGRIELSVLHPEEQVLPGMWPDVQTFDQPTGYA